MQISSGRYTAEIEGDFVVFLIGMRLNHPLRVAHWLPVAKAMTRMLKVIGQHPEPVYGNMPVFGLAAAGTHLPAARKGNTAAARIGASSTDEPAVEPY